MADTLRECAVPPAGWRCTRAAGHEGPCAAISNDYVAWLRWSGDEEHRHLVLCDSDSPGAFRVYRSPSGEVEDDPKTLIEADTIRAAIEGEKK